MPLPPNSLPRLTETTIRALATSQSFERGKNLYHSGAISNTTRRANTIRAECEGSGAPYYDVEAELDEAGVESASCTCPYDWGGYCKHIVALLLTYAHDPESFAVQREAAELVADLDRDALVNLFVQLVRDHPHLYNWLEGAAQALPPGRKGRRRKSAQVDPAPYRRQIQHILHSLDHLRSSEAYWEMGKMVDELRGVQRTATDFLDAGDAQTALTILTTLAEATAHSYGNLDDSDAELANYYDELGQALAEAILSAELNDTERRKLADQITSWADLLSDYGIDQAFDPALTAARHGWAPVAPGENEGDDNDYDQEDEDERNSEADLTDLQLNVLERQGRTDEYLALCLSGGRHLRYALKLLDLGRQDAATQHALKNLAVALDAHKLAAHLREAGHVELALKVRERGLDLHGDKSSLGQWLGTVEEGAGRRQTALAAWRAAFEASPSLENYNAIKRLAQPDWQDVRPDLMERLRAHASPDALVDVLLAEGEHKEAIEAADREQWNYRLLERVADAVIETQPQWVIRVSRKQAEELIERSQSKYYEAAARWLKKMKAASRKSGREKEWAAYLDDLRQRYARRPALQAQLRGL